MDEWMTKRNRRVITRIQKERKTRKITSKTERKNIYKNTDSKKKTIRKQ